MGFVLGGATTVKHPNVLIAESDGQLCRLYGQFLAREGYAVEVASGGVDCMSRLRRTRPTVLVIAQGLLWGGAAGVFSCLCHEGRPFPGVVLTICGLDVPPEDLLAAGVLCVLRKPFRLEALRQAVQRAALAGGLTSGPPWADAEGAQLPSQHGPGARPHAERSGVLVVDDEAGVRATVGAALRRLGVRVWLASSGHEAVEVYRHHRDEIEVALLDVRMPGMSGPRTLEALRAINPRLWCAFMTGDPWDDRTRGWLGRSGVPVLAKPIPLAELTRLVAARVALAAGHPTIAGGAPGSTVPTAGTTA